MNTVYIVKVHITEFSYSFLVKAFEDLSIYIVITSGNHLFVSFFRLPYLSLSFFYESILEALHVDLHCHHNEYLVLLYA